MRVPPKSAAMSGKAMLTMKRSRLAMKRPIEVIARVLQRCSMAYLLDSGGSLAICKGPYTL